MKHNAESLSKLSKAEIIEHTILLQNQAVKEYRVIPATPATPAVEEFTDDKGIKHPAVEAKEAIPAVSIRQQIEQLPEVVAYLADCARIDELNKVAEENFKSNPKVQEILTAKENATTFQEANKDKFAQLAEVKKAMAKPDANMRKLTSEYIKLESGIQYPADYDLSFEELPTYTPTPYADIDVACPSGCNGFPISFLLGGKKSAKVSSAKSESSANNSGTTSAWKDLSKEVKESVREFIRNNNKGDNKLTLNALNANFASQPDVIAGIEAAGGTKLIWVTLNK